MPCKIATAMHGNRIVVHLTRRLAAKTHLQAPVDATRQRRACTGLRSASAFAATTAALASAFRRFAVVFASASAPVALASVFRRFSVQDFSLAAVSRMAPALWSLSQTSFEIATGGIASSSGLRWMLASWGASNSMPADCFGCLSLAGVSRNSFAAWFCTAAEWAPRQRA